MRSNLLKKIILFLAPILFITSCGMLFDTDDDQDEISFSDDKKDNNDNIENVSKDHCAIYWYSGGANIAKTTVPFGSKPEFPKKYISKLTLSGKTEYEFYGWNRERQKDDIGEIEQNIVAENATMNLHAVYKIKEFAVHWYNGNKLIATDTLKYGEQAIYSGETPIKDDELSSYYEFIGWTKFRQTNDVGTIDTDIRIYDDTDIYAVYKETVTFVNVHFYNGTEEFTSKRYPLNEKIVYNGPTLPQKSSTNTAVYRFKGWNTTRQKQIETYDVGEWLDEIKAVKDNMKLFAVYVEEVRIYKIVFRNDKEEILDYKEYKYNETITKYNKIPEKNNTRDGYLYFFKGWSITRGGNGEVVTVATKANNDYTYYPSYDNHLIGADAKPLSKLLIEKVVAITNNKIKTTFDDSNSNGLQIEEIMKKQLWYKGNYSKLVIGNDETNNITEIDTDGFRYSPSLKIIIIGEGVKKINNFAFQSCKALSQLTLPSTITSISSNAFIDCNTNWTITYQSTISNFQKLSPKNWCTAKSVRCTDGTLSSSGYK